MWYKPLIYGLAGLLIINSMTMPLYAEEMKDKEEKPAPISLFLTGDVMTGRGIDQVLPHPGDPRIYEPYLKDAGRYVELAEEVNGPIKRPVSWDYIWGIALGELERLQPDVRIINLETAVTKSDEYWRGKGINYRMHPKNIPVITAAGIDVAILGNNHVLDWGYKGFQETIDTLKKAGIGHAGAGAGLKSAGMPAIVDVAGQGRVIVFSYAAGSSGVPDSWAASEKRAGVNLLADLSRRTVEGIRKRVDQVKRRGDIVIVSLHWGGNWGYEITKEQREFAHSLIDEGEVDVVHGHSSHHVKGIEVYGGKLILYGCGDLITDYEGIGGYDELRGDLGLMYFPIIDPLTGRLLSLKMIPTMMKRFRLNRPPDKDVKWMKDILNREGKKLETRVELDRDKYLNLKWSLPR